MGTVVSMLLLNFLPWLPSFVNSVFLRRPATLAGLGELSPMTLLVHAFDANYRVGAPPAGPGWAGATIYWGAAGLSVALSVALVAFAGGLLPRRWRRSEAGPTGRPGWRRAARGRTAGTRIRWKGYSGLPGDWLAVRDLREGPAVRHTRLLMLFPFGLALVLSVSTPNAEAAFTTAFCLAYALHLLTRVQWVLAATRQMSEDRRSGALELLLATPVNATHLIAGHHQALAGAFRAPLVVLLALNGALQLAVVVFPRQLLLGGGEALIFSAFFLGGALVTLADSYAIRWLGLREALRAPTQLRAVGRVLVRLLPVPWLAFAATFLAAVAVRNATGAAMCFAAWALVVVGFDWVLIRRCRAWLQPGLRRRVSEPG